MSSRLPRQKVKTAQEDSAVRSQIAAKDTQMEVLVIERIDR
ncbi:MAG: hypothetical protein NTX53_19510 [candidate division WOR-3 bacterium]|nr:hypothetical protein [candidate division WOR-3 bacterium]